MKKLYLCGFFIILLLASCSDDSKNVDSSSSETNSESITSTEESSTDSEPSQDSEDSTDQDNQKTFDLNVILSDTSIETEERWLQEDGTLAPNKDFVISESIEYNSENTYQIKLSGYVSYYKDDDFIQTNRYSNDKSYEIEVVPEANQVKVSYRPNALE